MPDIISPNSIAIIDKTALPTILAADKDDILGKLISDLAGFEPDGSTEAGRKACASHALKVSNAKMDYVRLADALKADAAKVVKGVNAEIKVIETRMDALRDQLLAPVEAFKERERKRVADHESALAAITEHPGYGQRETAAEIEVRLNQLINFPPRDWQEFAIPAAKAIAAEVARTRDLLTAARTREAEAAELARLRAEAAERERIAHEERIAAKARADAKEEAAREARAVAERAEYERQRLINEQRRQDAVAKAAQETKDLAAAEALARAERERQAAIDAAAKAERDLIAAADRAEQACIAAEAEAARREREAADRVRRKLAEREKAEADERTRRERDKAHRAKINREARDGLVAAGWDAGISQSIISAIAEGKIPHVRIEY